MSDEKDEKPKKGFGSLLKSAFFNETTEPETQASAAKPKPIEPTPQPTIAQSTLLPTSGVAVGVVNKDVYAALMQVMEDRNLPGPDYLELKKAADSMAGIIPDENTRYVSAYSVIKASNSKFTKAIILGSIDEYIKHIENERTEAKTELAQVYETEVNFRQKEIDKRVASIEANKKKIDELNAEILTASQEINTINGEMLAKQSELSIQEKNFNATVDAVINGLESDKNKLNAIIIE